MGSKWERRFYEERDRRYSELAKERERALRLMAKMHREGESTQYASKQDLAKAIREISVALSTGLADLETRITGAPRRMWTYVTTSFSMIVAGVVAVIALWPKR